MELPYVIFTLTETPFLTTLRIWKSKFNVNKLTRRKQSQLVSHEPIRKIGEEPKHVQEKHRRARVSPHKRPPSSIWSKYLGLSEMEELNSFTEGDFLMIISKILKLDRKWKSQNIIYWMERVCKDIKRIGLRLNKHTYEKIINAYARFDLVRAESILAEIFEENIVPTRGTYHILIYGYAKLGKIQRCLELFRDMKKHLIRPDLKTYNTLILAYVNNNDIKNAYNLLHEMDRHNVKPNIITFNTIIHGLLKFHDFKGTERCLEVMQTFGITPNVRTFNTLMSGYLDVGDVRAIEKIYHKMLKLKLQPGPDTYHTLMLALIQMGKTQQALNVMDHIIIRRLHVARTFNIIVNMYIKMKDFSMARETLARMRSMGLHPNVITYSTFISGCVNERNLDEAMKYFDEMVEQGISPNLFVLNILLKGYLSVHGMKGANSIILRMAEYNVIPDQVTYNILIQHIKERNGDYDFEEAMRQYFEMLDKGFRPTNRTFNTILGLAMKKDIHEHRFKSRLITFNDRTNNGKSEGAMETILMEMRKKHFVLDVITYGILMKNFIYYRNMEGAEKLIQIMQHNAVKPNQFIFNILLDGYTKIPDMDLAEMTVKRMLNCGFRKTIHVYHSLINGYANAGNIGAACKEFEEMKQVGITPDNISYTSLVNMFANNRQVNRAQQVFDYMNSQGVHLDLISFTVLMKAYALVGNVRGCNSTFARMISAGYEPDSVVILIMLTAYNRSEDINGAIDYLRNPRVVGNLGTWHYNTLLSMLARDRFLTKGTFKLFMKMLCSHDQSSDFPFVTEQLDDETNDSSRSSPTYTESKFPSPDIDSIHIVVSHFNRNRQWNYIMKLWDELCEREISPRTVDYIVFMRAFSKIKETEKMMEQNFVMVKESEISTNERNFILSSLKERIRLDGRDLGDFRPLSIILGPEKGRSEVRLGGTKVLSKVSCEVTRPYLERPSEGILIINAELSPMAFPEEEILVSRILEKALKINHAIDLEGLCIIREKKVWTIRVDIHFLDNDGNIIDAACIAAISALSHFRRPDVTVAGDDNLWVVDPCLQEEQIRQGDMTITINDHQEICVLSKAGGVPLAMDQIVQCSKIATRKVESITEKIRAALDADRIRRSPLNSKLSPAAM
ncbi:9016_t:CDS:2 [Acaulospora colombiana]|uniref:9016_t:CDS:1 n=1 Tax=Acaulospora colombiana TaxID=27376 RepID=A0ACA9LUU8_9GLOM|nr:9016_t:CDS:2 [Acaulospora colombiana]